MSPTDQQTSRSRRADLLSPEELAQLGGLELRTRAVVEGFFMGLHRSPHRGFSAEFAELRGYRPGDDLRYIDWRMWARSDRFYVKQFEEETNLRGNILLDTSASMGWSSRASLPSKQWYGATLAAAIALILLRQGDRAGLVAFDERIRHWLPARGGRKQWQEIVRVLRGLESGGTTDASEPLREVAMRMRRRSLVVLVSDLLVDRERTLRALRYLVHRKHQVLVLHLLDPGERTLGGAGDARFVEPETGEELLVDIAEVREDYRDAVERALSSWERTLGPAGVGYHVVDTSRPLAGALRAFLGKRSKLG